MLFDCVQDCYDNGTADKLDKWGHPVRFGYRRGTRYDLSPKDIARLCDHLTGVDDTARAGYPDQRGTPTREPEWIPVTGFLECFRTGDDFAEKWIEDHSDELLDIIEAKVEYIKAHPPKIGTVDPARVVLKRKDKSATQTLAEGRSTKPGASLLAEGDELSSRKTVLTRKKSKPGRRKASGNGETSLKEQDSLTADKG